MAAIFANLYPAVLISTTDPANTLTVQNSSASQYSLQVMSVAAAVLVPLVLAYQGWTYYVFRARVIGPSETVDRRPRRRTPTGGPVTATSTFDPSTTEPDHN